MALTQRAQRALQTLPAPVRWLAAPLVLLACTGAVLMSGGSYQPPITAPHPDPMALGPCAALMKALPSAMLGHPRADPPNSPYVAVWRTTPRTVLRCGVARPASLRIVANQMSTGPNVDGVQWYLEQDGHGGYRYTLTQHALYVEVAAPAGATVNATDALGIVSPAVLATIPDLNGQLGQGSDSDQPGQ
ncbi:DUF3515 domain-containing protein [Kitasatospora sp. NBC_01287]|uniref:DUF3515 domain-containing protein n=1 Tax=Kitasatospora sp. NBC_01287 TaxID=2903573 RepID=UPI0022512A3B|nr:DUF3515 domain-containing protein [Kitasatospora sp. NBC_01287]MCX4751682.1 DUF3515 domain-containing protein [Kitasatospora sp. NBC_01287]